MRALLLFVAFLFAAPVGAAPEKPVEVVVSREGDRFVATYTFPSAAPVWGFFRSQPDRANNASWRTPGWRVRTKGVRLVHRGHYDALIANRGAVPLRVQIEFAPFTGDLVSDYVPALRLGKGIAVFDGHFAVFELPEARLIDTLPLDLNGHDVGDHGTRVRFVDGTRPVGIAGDAEGYRSGDSMGAYGLFDVPVANVTNGVATVIDPALPSWLANDIVGFSPKVIDLLSKRLGKRSLDRPTIMAAWEGAGSPGVSMNGGALDGLVMMRFSGVQALAPNPALAAKVQWFIAHEASHFWLGQTVRYDRTRDSWIMEGGANLLAARTVARLDPAFDEKGELNQELADCAKLAAKPVGDAAERGEQRAFYACGAVFGMIAEHYSGGDFYHFVRKLIDARNAKNMIGQAEWLAVLRESGAPDGVVKQIATLIDDGAANPARALDRLLSDAGIVHSVSPDGVPKI